MVNNIADVCIIGAGGAGCFAIQRLLAQDKDLKIVMIDRGRPFLKRRHQIFGALGAVMASDGKLYLNNLNKVSSISGSRRTTNANKYVMEQLYRISNLKMHKDKRPSHSVEKNLIDNGFDLTTNNYYQLFPKDLHALSRQIVANLDKGSNITLSFDNEVFSLLKNKNHFSILTSDGEFLAKKILFCVGRGGWRFAHDVFNSFGIVENNDICQFGIKAELPNMCMKEFNGSNCTLTRNLVSIGPLSWGGTIIPEDHLDFALASFRSNETRWETDKVSFSIMAEKNFEGMGVQQTNRLAQLSFLMSNDRLMKEKISTLMAKKSKLSIMKEYNWLYQELETINEIIPGLIEKGYFHAPCLITLPSKISLNPDFETDVSGMYVVGESAGIQGILSAFVSGVVAADAILKG